MKHKRRVHWPAYMSENGNEKGICGELVSETKTFLLLIFFLFTMSLFITYLFFVFKCKINVGAGNKGIYDLI